MINAAKGQTHNNGERQGVIDIGFGYSNDTDDQSVLHNSMGFDSFLQKQEIGNFGQELDADWMCIASDYSVQYKRMHKRHYPLHSNNMSINLQKLSTVGDCKVADITRCTYTMQEGQCIRVSVHATLVFMQ